MSMQNAYSNVHSHLDTILDDFDDIMAEIEFEEEEERIYEWATKDLDFVDIEIGTCQGCGSYGTPGNMCVRNGEECGEYI